MVALIDQQDYAYDSLLVVRNGHIVFEQYRNRYDQNTVHHLQSATKSFSSMLIGIAIQEGLIQNVDQKMVDLFPEHTIVNMDTRKGNITLEHLLTISEGMDWHELDYPYTDPRNSLGQMWVSSDAVQYILDQPMAREPGESWAYNSGTSILLGGILEGATGQDVLDFAREYLFDPIGIGNVRWDKTSGDHYHTDGGLYMTPRDMARFGYLMLQKGEWDGKEIVSPEWVARSTEAHYQANSGMDYGYQWWVMEGGAFGAWGHYEQKIYVVPQADMVVVFTGNIPDNVLPPTDGLLYRYILGACTDLPSDATNKMYADYGLTFEYPTGFSQIESQLPETGKLDASSGLLQFRLDSYPFELVQISWNEEEPGMDPAEYLEEQLGPIPQQAGVEYVFGKSWTLTRDQHEVIHQYFDFESGGIQLRGVIDVW
jgi:CubicO group peptidase (beta-lactamase class C family)